MSVPAWARTVPIKFDAISRMEFMAEQSFRELGSGPHGHEIRDERRV